MHPLILYFRIQCENQSIHVFDTVTLIVLLVNCLRLVGVIDPMFQSAGAANLATGLWCTPTLINLASNTEQEESMLPRMI